MSKIVSTPAQILNSPANNSTAKMQYSFPKSPRFQYKVQSNPHFYDLPSTFDRRAAGIGYGTKSDFTKEKGRGVPSPDTYRAPSDFD